MKTDALFYKPFQTVPQTFFELLQITPACEYRFESITVKSSEKRIDGVLEPTDEKSLVLNVLRPLLAKNAREVEQNVVQWVENIRQTPNLDHQTEERVVIILSQFVEQKFRVLTYKELSRMLRLTPLEETISGQELIKNERVTTLTRLVTRKFALSEELAAAIQLELNKLDLKALHDLFDLVLETSTLEQLELWITDHLPAPSKPAVLATTH